MQCHLFTYFAIEMVTYDMNTINIYERENICTMVDFSEIFTRTNNSNNSIFKTKYSNFFTLIILEHFSNHFENPGQKEGISKMVS